MDLAEYNRILLRMKNIYEPIVREAGGRLVLKNLWNSTAVHAAASRKRDEWVVLISGGLARLLGSDSYALVTCHEMGHHLGGAPHKVSERKGIFIKKWYSNEGQADYYATAKCFRLYARGDDNAVLMRGADVPPSVSVLCERAHGGDEEEVAICERSGLAAREAVSFLASRRLGNSSFLTMDFGTSSSFAVEETNHGYPDLQCRLDTFFQGTLCDRGEREEVSPFDPNKGYCSRSHGDELGARPTCWYRPFYSELK